MMLQPHWGPQALAGAFGVAEEVAACDLNNLYRASCYFEDLDRYRAFCAQYAVMRVLDDRVDAIPSRAGLSGPEREEEYAVLDAWAAIVELAYSSEPASTSLLTATRHAQSRPLAEAFASSLKDFRVAPKLWRDFFVAMRRDIDRPRFGTYREFLRYSQGAAVAPTTIFLHLITGERAAGQGGYQPMPGFDLLAAGHSLGLFAYLGHVLRDLAEDLATGSEGLLYLAGDDLKRHRLDEGRLFEDLRRRRASPELQSLVLDLLGRARHHLTVGRDLLMPLQRRLTHDRLFVLELIVSLYEAVLNRIEESDGNVMGRGHRLSDSDKQRIAYAVWSRVSRVEG
jgi:phytoene/squalene synthetase